MVSNTIDLRRDIQNILLQVCPNICYRNASDKTPYPYIIFTVKDIFGCKILNIEYWNRDNNPIKSTGVIETLADNLEKVIDRYTLNNESHSLAIYYNEDRKWVDDEDKLIQRINESFEIRYYGKE